MTDWVRDNERGGGGGGSGEGVNAARALGADTVGGPWPSPEEEGDGDLGCMGWCASQPRLCSKGACEKKQEGGWRLQGTETPIPLHLSEDMDHPHHLASLLGCPSCW